MLENILRQGFTDAHRRFGLIFLDLIWKAVWLIATLVGLLLVFVWFGAQLQSVAWQDTGVSTTNAWIAITLVRDFWAAHQAAVFTAVTAVLLLSAFGWLWLEAFFHSRMVEGRDTKLFFLSGAARTAVLASTASV